MIRCFAGTFGQTKQQPIVWCSKYYYFFQNFLQNSLQNSFRFIYFHFFVVKIKSFECPNSLRNYENDWNIKRLVAGLFVKTNQRSSMLYYELTDLCCLLCWTDLNWFMDRLGRVIWNLCLISGQTCQKGIKCTKRVAKANISSCSKPCTKSHARLFKRFIYNTVLSKQNIWDLYKALNV